MNVRFSYLSQLNFSKMNFKSEIRTGILLSVGLFLWLLLEFFLGFHTTRIDYHPFITWLSIVIPIAGIYWSMKVKRDREYAGKISFVQALKSGFVVTAIMSLLGPIMVFVYVSAINPLFFSTMLAHSKVMIEGLNISVIDKEKMIEESTRNFSTSSYVIQSFIGSLIMGTVLSLLTAALMKRNTLANSSKADHSVTDISQK